MERSHATYLIAAFEVAQHARQAGNHPFGAVLVDEQGKILIVAENTVLTTHDITAHAELNLVRKASIQFDSTYLAKCSLYASTEPCPMCAGAIFWANIRKVIFGLSESGLYELIDSDSEEILLLPCREVFSRGHKTIDVIGPLLEDEAREVHRGFWK
jgi:tRNA(Arg) A34 adenosine deaminase TadA